MNVLIVQNSVFPALLYGGTERVLWYLAHELHKMGHQVSLLCKSGSECPFANCIIYNPQKHINEQIPDDIDIIHFNTSELGYTGDKPYVVTIHGNYNAVIPKNAIFVSRNHAERHGSQNFVYNGLDWDDYGELNKSEPRAYYHFLGKAAWRVKNVRGAINIIKQLPGEKLYVLGGTRLNFKMGFRFTISPKVKFKGMVGGYKKNTLLQHSKGLIFPVKWDEPFGLAITESLYCGCPVFGTPYGSLPELVPSDVGFLAEDMNDIAEHIKNHYNYTHSRCHEYARDLFNSRIMAENYVRYYERVLQGECF
ncbi:MAG: glycosyltransferase [Prevotella sp.]|nr:glycosyltransferase [Prevotella sp.]